jgi:hypothetical protein
VFYRANGTMDFAMKFHTGGKPMNNLTITRDFAAPRETVWKAWTIPEMFKKWWGPKDFTCPVARIDFKVGGTYLVCMRGPDGKDIWSTGTYKKIVPMEKIVCTDSFADKDGNVVPATYYGMEGMPEGRMGDMAEAGWNESFDKLGQSLNEASPVKNNQTTII